jgi:hypothetical protein
MKTSDLPLKFAIFRPNDLNLKSAGLAFVAFLLLVSPLPASGKKTGSFYCNAAKTSYPITKVDIRSTDTGFNIAIKISTT